MRTGVWLGLLAIVAIETSGMTVASAQAVKDDQESVYVLVELAKETLTLSLQGVRECNAHSTERKRTQCFQELERGLEKIVRQGAGGLTRVQNWIKEH